MRRRQYIAGLASAATLTLGSPTAAATDYANQPEDVTITGYDAAPADIEEYQPLLDLTGLDIEPTMMYAWRATSPDWQQDWYQYVSHYVGQQGVTDADSHIPDRELVTVGVESGTVTRALWTEWHYAIRDVPDPPLYQDTHVQLGVQPPHHGHYATDQLGQFVQLGDLTKLYSDWLVNGWTVHRPSVIQPPVAAERGNYWPESRQRDHRLATFWHDNLSGLGFNPFRIDTQ